MIKECCRNCLYWAHTIYKIPDNPDWEEDLAELDGYCLRYPPVYNGDKDQYGNPYSNFPTSLQWEWCGEIKIVRSI